MAYRDELLAQRRAKDQAFKTDPHSPIPRGDRARFKGLSYFAPDPAYRFVVPLVAGEAKAVRIPRSAGDEVVYQRRGHFELVFPGGAARLALYTSEGHAFLPFRDKTSGKTTYGAGRYLDPPRLDDGRYVLDFNLAYNPFCAYNEAYSCPFPPSENWLAVAVEAGEKDYPTA